MGSAPPYRDLAAAHYRVRARPELYCPDVGIPLHHHFYNGDASDPANRELLHRGADTRHSGGLRSFPAGAGADGDDRSLDTHHAFLHPVWAEHGLSLIHISEPTRPY